MSGPDVTQPVAKQKRSRQAMLRSASVGFWSLRSKTPTTPQSERGNLSSLKTKPGIPDKYGRDREAWYHTAS